MIRPALVTAQNSGRSARVVAVAVRSRSGAVRRCTSPALRAASGAEAGFCRVGPDGDLLAPAVLVGLGAAYQHVQAAAGDGGDIAQSERHQLGAEQRGAEAEQHYGALAG